VGRTLYGAKLLAVLASLTAQTRPGARIAVPVTTPSLVDKVVAAHGGSVVRTKTDPRYLMTVASVPAENIAMAGDLHGGMIFPDFHPAYDGLYSFVRVLEMLSWLQRPLSSLVDELPVSHVTQTTVRCPWDAKGAVMRTLTEEAHGRDGQLELIDGIKLMQAPDSWVQILPDPSEPTFAVHAEGRDAVEVQRLVEHWSRRIGEIAASA
jgi:mannose-1-phosphate guanylyltransferase/phosphomannomutase